ncbi:phage protein [Streptococcus pneumoniae]|nr:phage protein [Streptococcus pneumoniae]
MLHIPSFQHTLLTFLVLLSDKPILMDSMTAFGTLEMLGNESINLFQKLDVEGEYKGLADYSGQ